MYDKIKIEKIIKIEYFNSKIKIYSILFFKWIFYSFKTEKNTGHVGGKKERQVFNIKMVL